MNDGDIYIKTAAGVDEIQSRGRRLPPRLRTVLIMVDGTQAVWQLREAAARLGAPDEVLDLLASQGLIERSGLYRPVPQRPVPAGAATAPTAPSMPIAPPASAGPPSGRPEAERFELAKKFMNDTAVDALGLRAFFFTLKLEKCFTLADLQALLPDYVKAIAKGSGEAVAQALESQVRDKMR